MIARHLVPKPCAACGKLRPAWEFRSVDGVRGRLCPRCSSSVKVVGKRARRRGEVEL